MRRELTLTFDNGPSPGVTEKVLDVLDKRGMKATFFVIGQKAREPGGAELVEAIRARGHRVGNHTMTHGEPLGLLNDTERELAEIRDAEVVLSGLGVNDRIFRPTGHGAVGPHLLSPAAADYLRLQRYSVALWTLFVRDSKIPAGWADRALAHLADRRHQVLVVHDLPTGAMDDLPRFLDSAAELGYQVVDHFPEDALPMREGITGINFEADFVTTSRAS